MNKNRALSISIIAGVVAAVVLVFAAGGSAKKAQSAGTLAVRQTPLGKILVGAGGRTLYLFLADKPNRSTLSRAGFAVWPAYETKGTPQAGGGVKESIIHSFARCNSTVCPDGLFPFNGLTIDANGTLYGTVDLGGGASGQCGAPPALGCGIVYKLTPNAQGKFTETILYRFQGFADGAEP